MSSLSAVCVTWQEEWVAETGFQKQLNQTRIHLLEFLVRYGAKNVK